MILTCPACATRYVVPDETFSAGSRTVRCAKCSHQWHAEKPAEPRAPTAHPAADEAVAPEPEEAPARNTDDGAAGEAPAASEEGEDWTEIGATTESPPRSETEIVPTAPIAMRPARPARRSTPPWVWAGWAVLVLVVAAIAGGLFLAREPLVAAWPPIERLYAVLDGGMTATARPEPVSLSIESSELVAEGGQRRMNVVLRLTNLTDVTQALPVAVIHLIDEAGREVRTERISLPGEPLTPKESRQLRLRLDDVPAGLTRVRGEAAAPAS